MECGRNLRCPRLLCGHHRAEAEHEQLTSALLGMSDVNCRLASAVWAYMLEQFEGLACFDARSVRRTAWHELR